jgi:hypothetical protein
MEALSKRIQEIQDNAKRWSEAFATFTSPLKALDLGQVRAFSSRLQETQEGARKWAENFGTMVSRLESFDFQATLRALEKYAKTVTQRYCVLLLRNEWPPAVDVEITFPEQVLEQSQKLKSAEFAAWLDRAMIECHQADRTASILKGWEVRKCLTARVAILRQAVAAHQRGDFCTSIPAFLIVIEGLLTELYSHKGWVKAAHVKKYARKLTTRSPGTLGEGKFLRRFMAHVVLQDFVLGQPIPRGLSRHAILHGVKTDYGTEAHSLKAILTIEMLSSHAQFITRRGDARFHAMGCSQIRKPPRFVNFYPSEEEPRRRGFKPCVTCTAGAP